MEIVITLDNYNAEVVDYEGEVIVDFWASWCGPCMALSPTIAQIAKEYAGKIKVCKCNVDEAPELAGMFGIDAIPCVIYFKNGEPVSRRVGCVPKADIVSMWES